MGLAMASNLQKHLASTNAPPLHFTNRTLSRGVPLVELGGIPCPTIAEVVEKSDIIFLSVSPFLSDNSLAFITQPQIVERRRSPPSRHQRNTRHRLPAAQNHSRHHDSSSRYHQIHLRLNYKRRRFICSRYVLVLTKGRKEQADKFQSSRIRRLPRSSRRPLAVYCCWS
jgi:hypothetical protein